MMCVWILERKAPSSLSDSRDSMAGVAAGLARVAGVAAGLARVAGVAACLASSLPCRLGARG